MQPWQGGRALSSLYAERKDTKVIRAINWEILFPPPFYLSVYPRDCLFHRGTVKEVSVPLHLTVYLDNQRCGF